MSVRPALPSRDPSHDRSGTQSPSDFSFRQAAANAFQHLPGTAHEPVRTFHPRRSLLSTRKAEALTRLWPHLGFSVHDAARGLPPLTADGTLDTVALFGREAPLVVEIGSGMGEATVAMAAADPARDYLAVEAHLPGIANLLALVEEVGLSNVCVAHGDALDLLRLYVPEASLDAIHIFFPDPWRKVKHHKRRIVAPDHVALLRSRLVPGGTLHCATDWAPYAKQMLEVLSADPGLENVHAGFAPRPSSRPVTKFEQRGIDLGHEVADLVFRAR